MESFVITYLLPILGSFLAIVISALATIVTRWLYKKLGKSLSLEQEQAMEKAIADAIWAAEENAAKQLKDGKIVSKMTSGLKYDYVLNFIGNRFPELSREEAEMKINSIIGKTPGLGASGNVSCGCDSTKPNVIPDEKNWRIVEDDRPVIGP